MTKRGGNDPRRGHFVARSLEAMRCIYKSALVSYGKKATLILLPLYKSALVCENRERFHAMANKKNPHAVALGRLGGLKGGKARMAPLTAKQRRELARKAVLARWAKARAKSKTRRSR